jgi:hypothetical protein
LESVAAIIAPRNRLDFSRNGGAQAQSVQGRAKHEFSG